MSFPSACRKYLFSLPGNSRCVDCGSLNPDWASVTYGTLLCVRCSGRHRSYGVTKSRVRSISLDSWSHAQVLAVLEGGNEQLQQFFQRHQMGNSHNHHHSTHHSSQPAIRDRYQTKAALFYRAQLEVHVEKIAKNGQYKGRLSSRQRPQQQQESKADTEATSHTQTINTTTATVCHEEQARANSALLSMRQRRISVQ
jgi:hypothetical protein